MTEPHPTPIILSAPSAESADFADPSADRLPLTPHPCSSVIICGSAIPGLRVRTAITAGDWQCSDCQGRIQGSQLFRPTCSFCVAV